MPHDYLELVRERSGPLFDLAANIVRGATQPHSTDGASVPAEDRYVTVHEQRTSTAIPDVSVIVPTFQRPDLITDAVESVCRQPRVQLEIVIVNDGGVELPRSVVDRFASHSQPITVVRHHRNLGLGASRNTGARIARGTWLMMLDDDDTLVDESVEHLLDAAHAHKRAEFIFGDHLRQSYEGHTATARQSIVTVDQRLEELHIENPIMCGSFIIKRESFAALRGYREDLPVHEDYNLHVRALASIRWAYVGGPICVYHCRGAIPRLNHRRLYWFATSAFNHAVFRSLFGRTNDRALIRAQRENQYAHLSRALDEGCTLELARSLVQRWWRSLASRGLSSEVSMDQLILSTVCPALLLP